MSTKIIYLLKNSKQKFKKIKPNKPQTLNRLPEDISCWYSRSMSNNCKISYTVKPQDMLTLSMS